MQLPSKRVVLPGHNDAKVGPLTCHTLRRNTASKMEDVIAPTVAINAVHYLLTTRRSAKSILNKVPFLKKVHPALQRTEEHGRK